LATSGTHNGLRGSPIPEGKFGGEVGPKTGNVTCPKFPAWKQKGDTLYYASYFADKTINPFIPNQNPPCPRFIFLQSGAE